MRAHVGGVHGHVGPVRVSVHPHGGYGHSGGRRRPPRSDRVQRVGSPAQKRVWPRVILTLTVAVPLVVTAVTFAVVALALLAAAAVVAGQWAAFRTLLTAIAATASTVRLLHTTEPWTAPEAIDPPPEPPPTAVCPQCGMPEPCGHHGIVDLDN